MVIKKISFLIPLLCFSFSISAQKDVYIPRSIRNAMDLNSSSSQWSYSRSRESDNVVVLWEPGFGTDPSTAPSNYRVNMDTLLQVAEKSYSFYLDSLKFAIKGSSVTDKYKLIIFLLNTTQWTANGSGEDDRVGSLRVNPAAAKINNVVAHEIGHCFQYISGCDGDGGYRYGLGENGQGGNGFWEQCANWMAFKVYPEKQFTDNVFNDYVKQNHLHILHENPRYANCFIQDYWTYKHSWDFVGKLWRDSRFPEDPVETYKRLNSISQAQFNDEMYEHASRLTTWDIPHLQPFGEKYIDSRAQVKMTLTSDNHWLIDPSVCIENYGYNSIKLNAPSKATEVTVLFKGKTGSAGFRNLKAEMGGWRYGFVALLKNGERAYSDMATANVVNDANPEATLTFNCPPDCSKLWLVVSGAPQEHWKHAWDDSSANDEQWPYQVRFKNTNLLGEATSTEPLAAKGVSKRARPVVSKGAIYLTETGNWRITDLLGKQVVSGYGNLIDIASFSNGGYIVHCSEKCFKIIR